MKILLLTFLRVLCIEGFSFDLPNGKIQTDGLPEIPKDFLAGLPNELPKDLFSGLSNGFPHDFLNGAPNDLLNGIPSGLSDDPLNGPNDPSLSLPKDFLNGLQKDVLKTLPSEYPKDLFKGISDTLLKTQADGRRSNVFPNIPNEAALKPNNTSCCYGGACFNPCPYNPGLTLPYPIPVPEPVVIPARTYYEPVIHNHPPIDKIRKIINRDKRKRHRSYESGDTDYSDTETDSDSVDSDRSVNYYDDFIPIRARRQS